MGRAKEIIVKVIPAKIANEFVKKHHYSGKVDPRCYVHFGCFLDDKLHGVMQLGPSINKHASVNLVKDTHWNGYCELARVAFDDYLPANSESRCLSVMMRLLKKQAPHIEWVVSYADGAQCGDGSIYRASGFYLVDIKKNTSMWKMPSGDVVCSIVFNPGFSPNSKNGQSKKYGKVGEFSTWPATRFLNYIGASPVPGFQLKYIYFLNESAKERLTVPILPFSKIDEMGAGMYKGEKITQAERHNAVKAQEKCAGHSSPEVAVVPTPPLKDDIAMAQIYNKKDLFEQAKKAIKDNNLFFFSDVIAFLPCHGDTFYQYFRPDEDEHTELREMLEDNKIRTKSSIRAKLFKSQKAAELLALYRLICTPEEHRLLNQQYIESRVDAKVTGFNVKDIVTFDRKRREEEED